VPYDPILHILQVRTATASTIVVVAYNGKRFMEKEERIAT